MKNFSIKVKLILIFILIKIVPLLIVSYISYKGAVALDGYMKDSTKFLFNQTKEIILHTANQSINDSVENLDKKSQHSLERLSYEIANNVAQFLYQRDEDILLLSNLDINQQIIENFFKSKNRDIIVHEEYIYNDISNKWESTNLPKKAKREKINADLKDNEKEFNFVDPLYLKTKTIPIYKEISYFDLSGTEIYKVSQINKELLDVSDKQNTYIKSEDYFNKIKNLKKDEIYVSNVVGEYVGSKVIGTFTKEKANKLGIEFDPKKHAYAGKENPVGKRFEGIVRFITPIYKDNKKIGYLSFALDHEHIMQFTDTSNPTSADAKQNIADASIGNYAFMWDNKGRNISHARDYFIVGYDKSTGKEAQPWLSLDMAKKFENSNQNINDFLDSQPEFKEQSLIKKANIKQVIMDGNAGLDCRYLNFAPQCQGWMQLTKNGGYGSFVIYWSKVWKLTTAASIPYFTGQYKNSKRGFGFVTIGANVDEFHSAANKTRENVNKILSNQTKSMKEIISENEIEIESFIKQLINELTVVTFIMVLLIIIIALWLSSYISKKIENILIGTKKFTQNELDYRIEVHSGDEIGELEQSFNDMASQIDKLVKEEKQLNETLEQRVEEEIKKQREQEQILIQQSKLASMGEMIGNIAHQWRQPLNSLSLVIQNIKLAYQMDELNDEFIAKSTHKATVLTNNMSKTIDDFRNFYRPNKHKEEFLLTDSIEKVIELVSASFVHNQIRLSKEFSQDSIKLLGYPNEFSQALLNILNNAKDALVEIKKEDKCINIKTFIESNNCVIEISNNASSIDEEIIDRIFDPYFTTKIDSKGTGIGLYMTKTIIENNMSGKVTVDNKSEKVTFIIKVPIINK